jgi:hypothetical protein
MSSQIFKQPIQNEMIFNLLEKICIKEKNCYIFNNIAFKKGMYNNILFDFVVSCIPYYHKSKQHYLEKKITYKSFATILRQICNHNKIRYKNKISYSNSNYEIIYYIYFDETS